MRRPRRRQARDRRNYLLSGLLLILLLAGVAAATYFTLSTPKPADAATLCPPDGPRGQVVLLVDKTEPLTFTQGAALRRFMADFGRDGVGEGELVSIYVLGEDYRQTPTPVLEMCNPGRGDDKSRLTANPERLQHRYQERFAAPLDTIIDQLQASKPARFSPIMEMLQLVSINTFQKWQVRGPRRLVIISDMLHNTPEFSHYRADGDFDSLRGTAYQQRLRTDLEGVEVEIRYLLHAPKRQTRRNTTFWEEYFREMKARVVSVKIMEG